AFYYRLLGIVTWFGMSIWAIFALSLVSILGRSAGYTLTLAGIAGLIGSMGITADSYSVFYERLKDEVRHGKRLRTAVQPALTRPSGGTARRTCRSSHASGCGSRCRGSSSCCRSWGSPPAD